MCHPYELRRYFHMKYLLLLPRYKKDTEKNRVVFLSYSFFEIYLLVIKIINKTCNKKSVRRRRISAVKKTLLDDYRY